MTPAPLEFHHLAVEEARAARRWYARRSRSAANRFLAELQRALQQIMFAPKQWPASLNGTRVFRLRRFPYVVVFAEQPLWVLVVAVAHTRRKPGYWRRRIP
jgi:plasmid stabilization system protein ParE